MKDVLLLILEAAMVHFKKSSELNSDKKSKDTYKKWYNQSDIMINTIKNGGIK